MDTLATTEAACMNMAGDNMSMGNEWTDQREKMDIGAYYKT
jgi:hypothetical protein